MLQRSAAGAVEGEPSSKTDQLFLDLPGRAAPLEVVRHERVARRFRLRVPELWRDDRLARQLEAELRERSDVLSAKADARSGRMLVCYAEGAHLLDGLRARRLSSGAKKKPRDAAPWAARPWHGMTVGQALAVLGTCTDGLPAPTAARRLAELGENVSESADPRSRLALLGSQLANLPTLLLLGSSGLSLVLRDFLDAVAILTVVGLNATIGYVIERKNEELLASWRRLEAGDVQVVRASAITRVPAFELVPGDILLCRAGDIVPADARVMDAHRLTCDEAALTGESEPQAKHPLPVAETAALGERSSMMYAGTTVSTGHGRAVVVETGRHTELAAIRQLVEAATDVGTPLEQRLRKLGREVTLAAAFAAIASGFAGLLRGRPLASVLRSAVALGVAAMPEGLPVVSTAALLRSMQRMRAHGIVVRRLVSAETLGGVTVICADKTGTLTENDMRLEVLDVGGKTMRLSEMVAHAAAPWADPPTLALLAGLLNSDIDLQPNSQKTQVAGSSTERALVRAAEGAGLDPAALRRTFPRRILRERKDGIHYVVSVHDTPDGSSLAFIKGAPEQVVPLCDLGAPERASVLARNDQLAATGLRVLALGWKRLPKGAIAGEAGRYAFIGLAGLRDPLRTTAADAVRASARAGIRTLILTGDQLRTAKAIAHQVGLSGQALDGGLLAQRLDASDAEALASLDRIGVLARVSPADKVAIVHALRRRGDIVAMVGDGINDAPALKIADVGVAVGAHSSDLARQVADVVLMREDLRSILAAVGEGRIVQDNLRRAVRFLFGTNLSEMALMLGAAVLGAREPLRPLQLLWINLLSDTLPALALALQPGQPEVLDRPPASPSAPLLSRAALREMGRDGLLLAGLGATGMVLGGPSLAFGALTAAQLSYATVCRAPRSTLDGRFLSLVGGAIALQGAAIFWSPLRRILSLGPFAALEPLAFVGGLLLPPLIARARDSGEIVRRARLGGDVVRFHLPSFVIGYAAGAATAVFWKRLRPLALEIATATYRAVDIVTARMVARREDLEDLLAEARARARSLFPKSPEPAVTN